MYWADGKLDDPGFPEIPANGPMEKTKKQTAWGHQCDNANDKSTETRKAASSNDNYPVKRVLSTKPIINRPSS